MINVLNKGILNSYSNLEYFGGIKYGNMMDLRGENRLALDPRQHYFDKLIRSCELKLVRRENILFRVASQGSYLYETLFVNI